MVKRGCNSAPAKVIAARVLRHAGDYESLVAYGEKGRTGKSEGCARDLGTYETLFLCAGTSTSDLPDRSLKCFTDEAVRVPMPEKTTKLQRAVSKSS